jgi:serine phosphatase RsbU (regulator of sigma subunit)
MIIRDGHTLEAPRMRFALGSQAFDESSLIPYEHEARSGDVLAFFTDGLKDQLDATGRRRIGRKRIQQVVQENSNGSFGRLDLEVRAAINAWRGPAEQTDDMSLIGIKF